MSVKLDVIVFGVKVKLKRGGSLEKILSGYNKLTSSEKDYIRKALRSD